MLAARVCLWLNCYFFPMATRKITRAYFSGRKSLKPLSKKFTKSSTDSKLMVSIRNSMLWNNLIQVKFIDNSFSGSGTSTTWTACSNTALGLTTGTTLFCPSQGTTASTRIGNQVKVIRIEACGAWYYNSVESSASNSLGAGYIRTIFVLDKQTCGANFSSSDVMSPSGPVLERQLSYKYYYRFAILQDDMYVMQPTVAFNQAAATLGAGDTYYNSLTIQEYAWNLDFSGTEKSLGKPIVIDFLSPAGAANDISNLLTNSFGLLANALTDASITTSVTAITHRGNFRFYYIDSV